MLEFIWSLQETIGNYAVILPMLILIIAALLLPAIRTIYVVRNISTLFGTILILVSIIVNLVLLTGFDNPNGVPYTGIAAGTFVYDQFSGLMILLFQIVLLLCIFVSAQSSEVTRIHFSVYCSLMFIASVGMMFVVSSTSLIGIFVGVEAVSISSYALVALKKGDSRSQEAQVKYVVIGGLSTALTLYGISMLYGALHTVDLRLLGQALTEQGYSWAFVVGVATMIAGYGFKIAAVPFHMWAPDVYEGAATPVSIFLATGSKKMGLAIFLKIFLVMFISAMAFKSIEAFQYVFAVLAAVTMTVGNVVAISQTNIKRMLAYSSIAQAGYILIIMAVMSEYAVTGGIFHMFTHVFMKGGAFLVVGALVSVGIGEKISDYNGLSVRAPLLAFAMMIFLFSLAGVPPLAGFTSKFVLFSGAIYVDGVVTQWVWLAFIAVLNSAISLYYYVKVIHAMYVEKAITEDKLVIPLTFRIAIVACVAFVIILGVYPDLILNNCAEAAKTLMSWTA